jgi:endonuclease YncB( thermonuclease family)
MMQQSHSPYQQCLDVAIIERVYDGDTFYVTFPSWHPIVGKEVPIRIKGIDTPELRTQDPVEKAKALEAKRYVEMRLIGDNKIVLCNDEARSWRDWRDKYFRLNADVYVNGSKLADELIARGLAVPYDGGTKTKDWSE